MTTLASDYVAVPVILDDVLRQRLERWLLSQVHAWERDADGLQLHGATSQADVARAKAAVVKQLAADLHDAQTRYPTTGIPQ